MSDPDLSESQMQAAVIYSEWRQSLSYGRHTYKDISDSIDEAIVRCRQEISHIGVRDSVIEQWKFMQARLSEFTVDTFEADDLPDLIPDASVTYSGSCFQCGRPIAEFEKKFQVKTFIGLQIRGEAFRCVDCQIKS